MAAVLLTGSYEGLKPLFPVTMLVDYIRVYRESMIFNAVNHHGQPDAESPPRRSQEPEYRMRSSRLSHRELHQALS